MRAERSSREVFDWTICSRSVRTPPKRVPPGSEMAPEMGGEPDEEGVKIGFTGQPLQKSPDLPLPVRPFFLGKVLAGPEGLILDPYGEIADQKIRRGQ